MRGFAARLVLCLNALIVPAFGQLEPESAHVLLYFPQLADGGPATGQQWQTILTFSNPNTQASATVTVYFYNNFGTAMPIDFGAGPRGEFSFTLPPAGVRVFKSRIASPLVTTGWAVAASSYPVMGMVTFRMIERGRPMAEIADQATSPTIGYTSFASRNLGIAVANIYTSSLSYVINVRDSEGQRIGSTTFVLSPLGHTSFTLWERFPFLALNFVGTVDISPTGQDPNMFVAWTLNSSDAGLLASLPSGRYAIPISHHDRIWKVFQRIKATAVRLYPTDFANGVKLNISYDRVINAQALRADSSITIFAAISELIGDSDSELAAVIAHELAHIHQYQTNRLIFSDNVELDADCRAVLFLLVAGYDPYAMAGLFGRLQMISGQPGMLGEQYREETLHRSFSTRIETTFSMIQTVCSTTEGAEFCPLYKRLFHGHFPSSIPLRDGSSAGSVR